ncbi:MAG: preQ(1) synthase [Bacillota bacterium]
MKQTFAHLGTKSILTPAQIDNPRSILDTFPNPRPQRDYQIKFVFPEFTSVCPVTGQPDFATITLSYIPDRLCVEMKSLKLYYLAYRNKGIFYESVVNTILDDLIAVLKPRQMTVIGDFAVRGGTAGTVTAEYETPKRSHARRR